LSTHFSSAIFTGGRVKTAVNSTCQRLRCLQKVCRAKVTGGQMIAKRRELSTLFFRSRSDFLPAKGIVGH